MRSMLLSAAALALATAQLGAAQTFTTCNPLNTTCPPDKALGKTITVDFTKGASSEFNLAEGTTLKYDPVNGAAFTINKETDAPTITSNWYIFFGKVDIVLQAAPGQGIVSSFVMESDDLDEIDLEWLGGDTTQVETNYFGKGNTTTYDRATYVPVAAPQNTFHTYTVDWTAEAVKWYVDGNLIRTLAYGDANGGANYPQTPMQVKMGNWDGGSSTSPKGTVEWAGGLTNFADAPFTLYVRSITIQDYSTGGDEYVYSDYSGSWQSIKTEGGSGSSGSSSSSSSSASSSSATVASTSASKVSTSTVKSSTASSSSFSTVTTVPVASGAGLGAGAVTASVSSNVSATSAGVTSAGAASTSAAGSTSSPKPTSNAGAAIQAGSSFGMAFLGLALTYFVM